MASTLRVLGGMNGTSLDGMDYALCEFQIVSGRPRSVTLKSLARRQFPKSLKDRLLNLARGEGNVRELSDAHFDLGRLYSRHLKDLRSKGWRFDLVGLHGQTIDHNPPRSTLQIGSMPVAAEAAGCPVISDFRSKDVGLGGQGAPLAPFFHQFLWHTLGPARKAGAFINLGGIANVTYIPAAKKGKLLAWDTGPANLLLDLWVQEHAGLNFDRGGRLGARGLFSVKILKKMLQHPYFKKKPPKSTGRELFNRQFLKPFEKELSSLSLEDQVATLTEFTAVTVAADVRRFISEELPRIIVSGGGAANSNLMKRLRSHLATSQVVTSEELGWPIEAVEAGAFAYLAALHHLKIAVPLKSITGGENVVLGSSSF